MHALSAPALWLSARAMLAALYAIVGDGGVGALARLTRKQRREALDWLKPLEIMVRKLLLIEAYGLSASRTPARLRAQQAANSTRTRAPVFALLAPAARRRRAPMRITLLGGPLLARGRWIEAARAARIARLHAAAPAPAHTRLANRIAALARVLKRPLGAARRLARRLAQSGRAQNCALARAIANAFCRPQPALFRIRDHEAATQHARRVAGDTS